MNKILIVVGTRPNFIKVTQFKKVNARLGSPFDIKIVHTGQHYDDKLADVESGLRSNDRTMPEEINRILTDEITDYFFITEQDGMDNLKKQGKENLFMVGNTMIDTLVAFDHKIQEDKILEKLGLTAK